MSECLFCRIVAGEIPADIVLRSDDVVAFRDISPQAPVHVLVIPTEHHESIASLGASDPALAGRLVEAVSQVAKAEGLETFRTVFNTGPDAGQAVFHVHAHVMGGRPFDWPPG